MNKIIYLLMTILIKEIGSVLDAVTGTLESCDNKVYCQGPVLYYVTKSGIFQDSIDFVGMKMIMSEEKILADFNQILKISKNQPTKAQIKLFVDQHFEHTHEVEKHFPTDFKPHPTFLNKIYDVSVRNFAKSVVAVWPQLTRKVKPEVLKNQKMYSIIPLPHPFIIPGGRFKEIYFWDSYWVIKGLLISEMTETVKGMLLNFISMVKRYGFIPNGSRVYYLNRSQPPLLPAMVKLYVDYTDDIEFVEKNIKYLEKELNFWLRNKTVEVMKGDQLYTLAHYTTDSGTPRPESFYEDIKTARYYFNKEDRMNCYKDLKAGAETGWDFSSRWIFDEHGGNHANLSFIQTRRVAPVDLNAFLVLDFKILASFYDLLERPQKGEFWREKANEFMIGIEEVFYNEQDGIWFDYDIKLLQQRKFFYPSNFAPLWADAVYDKSTLTERGDKAAKYLNKYAGEFPGGIPTSLSNYAGQQWDLPNAWPPLQDLVIKGLELSGSKEAQKVAKEYANKWIKALMLAFRQNQALYEKYSARIAGKRGGGGEYAVQEGFGWTNGNALDLIVTYYSE